MRIEQGLEYYWKRTDGWKWFDGRDCWWEVFIVFHGTNGGGGANVEERWRWNSSSETMRTQSRNLTIQQTNQLIEEIESGLDGRRREKVSA